MTTLYLALSGSLLVADGHGAAWRTALSLEGKQPTCVGVDPLHPERVYCGTFDQGLWRSDDAGRTWEPVGAGIAHAAVMAVAVSALEHAGDHGVVYAGTEPTALYRSEDGGATWRECAALRELPSAATWSFPPRPYTSHVRALALDPNETGRLLVAIEAGALVRSVDAGRTWEDRRDDGPGDSHTLAMPATAPGRVYAAAGDGFMAPGNGFAESHDAGETWRRSGAGLGHHYLWGLAVDPGDPDTIIVSAAAGPYQAHDPAGAESAVYRRQGDDVWERTTAGLPEPKGTLAAALAANAAEPGVFYAATNRGVFRSTDAGASWARLDVEWPGGDRVRPQALAVVEQA